MKECPLIREAFCWMSIGPTYVRLQMMKPSPNTRMISAKISSSDVFPASIFPSRIDTASHMHNNPFPTRMDDPSKMHKMPFLYGIYTPSEIHNDMFSSSTDPSSDMQVMNPTRFVHQNSIPFQSC